MLQCTVRVTATDTEAWAWVIDALAAEMGDVAPEDRAALIDTLMARADAPARALLGRITARLSAESTCTGLDLYLPMMFPDEPALPRL